MVYFLHFRSLNHREVDMTDSTGFQEFLNPKSMITPGAAGAITMAITNALCAQFNGLPGNWVALTLSFLFGGLVAFSFASSAVVRFVYLIVNSLIIFVMASGSNTVGGGIESRIRKSELMAESVRIAASEPIVLAMLAGGKGLGLAPHMRMDGSIGDQPIWRVQVGPSDERKKPPVFAPWGW
jgi:hypothetical protein